MSLKPFVNNPEIWKAFLQELDERIEACLKTLERATDPVLIYREQGKVETLKKLKELRDKVNGPNQPTLGF